MSDLVVKIHVPLTATKGLEEGEYRFPWILDVDEFLADLDGEQGVMFDDGEEDGDEYVFYISGATESELLVLARSIAARPGVPAGAYAIVTDAESGGAREQVDLDS